VKDSVDKLVMWFACFILGAATSLAIVLLCPESVTRHTLTTQHEYIERQPTVDPDQFQQAIAAIVDLQQRIDELEKKAGR
jgi:hypothetical protein